MTFIFNAITRSVDEYGRSTVAGVVGVIGLLNYLVVKTVYRIYFHPLRKIPGPKLAAATHLVEFYYDVVKGGMYLWEIEKMHEKYGR